MNNYEGIIIKKVSFKESSTIIYLLTPTGIDSLLVQGSKKIGSKDHVLNELFTRISYNKTSSTGLAKIITYDILNSYQRLKKDLTSLNHLNIIIELIYANKEELIYQDCYFFLVKAFEMIDDGYDYQIITDIFITKFLWLIGISPNLSSCVVCGLKSVVGLSLESGGLVCQNHTNQNTIFDNDLIIYLSKCFYANLNNLDFSHNKNALKTLINYYEYHQEKRLKSYEMLKMIDELKF